MKTKLVVVLEVNKKSELSARHDLLMRLDTVRKCIADGVIAGVIDKDYNNTTIGGFHIEQLEEETAP